MIVGGHNVGRVGVITSRERHLGSFDIVHVKDNVGRSFATRLSNVFVIGKMSVHARAFHAELGAGAGRRRRGCNKYLRNFTTETICVAGPLPADDTDGLNVIVDTPCIKKHNNNTKIDS